MESIEEEEDGADPDHSAEDERVPSLSQVDSLDQVVDGWKTIWGGGATVKDDNDVTSNWPRPPPPPPTNTTMYKVMKDTGQRVDPALYGF